MPLFLTDETILEQKSECIVCPIKGFQLYLFEGIDKTIYEKAGKQSLLRLFDEVNPLEVTVPVITNGLDLSEKVIHIIAPDLINCRDFKLDIYTSYDRIFKMIKDHDFKNIVFPPIEFSYKRLGAMHSYKTAITLMKYFISLYELNDCNIYILTNKRTVQDHLDNYVSTYISSSYPISKRHKPINYPLKNDKELQQFLSIANIEKDLKYIASKDYFENLQSNQLHKIIKEKFDDKTFCEKANIHKDRYIKIINNEILPSKDEVCGMCIALQLDISETIKLFNYFNYKVDYSDSADCYVLSFIAIHKYDLFNLNERLFVNNLRQIGSNENPIQTKEKTETLI